MAGRRGISRPVDRARQPRRTVRRRLAVLYCALFLPLGLALIAITAVVTFSSSHPVVHQYLDGKPVGPAAAGSGGVSGVTPPGEVHVGSLTLDVHQFVTSPPSCARPSCPANRP